MATTSAKQTRAMDVRSRMRLDILAGRLMPGQRLMFPDLCDRYGASVGVTREALTWLTSQGLVRVQAHQGHMVTPLSREDLQDLAAARISVEPLVLRLAMSNRDLEWEGRVVAAHHVMSGTRRPGRVAGSESPDPDDAIDRWAAAHAAFHDELFSACPNQRLLAMTRTLAEEAALYRRWSDSLTGLRDVSAEHRALLDATLSGDVELATSLLCEHISRTAEGLITFT